MELVTVVVYTTFITAGLIVVYALLLTVEVKKEKRAVKKFRIFLDTKMLALFERVGKGVGLVSVLYRKGSDEVEKDLIDPVTKPIVDTRRKYIALKTGERKIRRAGLSRTSPHLQKLLQKSNKSGKKKSRKSRKKIKKLQQEVQREMQKNVGRGEDGV